MRYTPEQIEQTRQRIIDAAGREFRAHGFGGVGVDALAHAAGVTSGAFYSQFGSKAEAFRAVAAAGLVRLRLGVEHFQREHGAKWFDAFAAYYLSPAHRADVANGCAMPSLTAEVGRAADTTRADYQAELLKLADVVADGFPHAPSRAAAWPLLAQLTGGVMMCRAVPDEAVAQEIANAVLKSVCAQAKALGEHKPAR